MFTSQLAFRKEFERVLVSESLNEWFACVRRAHPALADFSDTAALARFLHSPKGHERRLPGLWRALIQGVQEDRSADAVTFLIGLLQPALGAFVDRALVDGIHDDAGSMHIDAEDAWQQAVAAGLQDLSNSRTPERDAILAGVVVRIRHGLRTWVQHESDETENRATVTELLYDADFDGVDQLAADRFVLEDWCRAAGIGKKDNELIFATRVAAIPLSQLVPSDSQTYDRLQKRRERAEARLRCWLIQNEAIGPHLAKRPMSENTPKDPSYKG